MLRMSRVAGCALPRSPLSAGPCRRQRRSCSLRCACSTLTPPTRRHEAARIEEGPGAVGPAGWLLGSSQDASVWLARSRSSLKSWARWVWPLAGASSCWAWRVGRNSMLVWKNAQVSQIDSNAQSSSVGRVQWPLPPLQRHEDPVGPGVRGSFVDQVARTPWSCSSRRARW